MTIKKINNIFIYPGDFLLYKASFGRVGECGPIAVRNAYAFFGIECPLTYKDFQDFGFVNDGGQGVSTIKSLQFFKHRRMGLDIKVIKSSCEFDFVNRLRKAYKNNHPVIIGTDNHLYLIVPHCISSDNSLGYISTSIGKLFNSQFKYPFSDKVKICICIGSFFHLEYPRDVGVFIDGVNCIEAVPTNIVWNRLVKEKYFMEVRGIKTNINEFKTHPYRWNSTTKEYKKYNILRKKRCDYFYNQFISIYCEAISRNDLDIQRGCYKSLQGIFNTPLIGEDYKRDFDKNLPMISNIADNHKSIHFDD